MPWASSVAAHAVDGCELVLDRRRRPEDERTRDELEAAWRAILERRPHVFDGDLLSVRAIDVDGGRLRLEVETVGYREYLVQREGLELGVRPLGVTGVTYIGERVLIGRRSALVTQYPDRWEPVPAGSVAGPPPEVADGDVLAEQVLSELEEETGIRRGDVSELTVVGVIEDRADRVVDVCFRLHVEAAGVGDTVAAQADEHSEIRLCPPAEAERLAADAVASVPTMAPALALAARPAWPRWSAGRC